MKVKLLRQPLKFLKTANRELKEKTLSELHKLRRNPYNYPMLKGTRLSHLRKYSFRYKGVSYRVAYQIIDHVIIVAIAKRENFYKKLTIRL